LFYLCLLLVLLQRHLRTPKMLGPPAARQFGFRWLYRPTVPESPAWRCTVCCPKFLPFLFKLETNPHGWGLFYKQLCFSFEFGTPLAVFPDSVFFSQFLTPPIIFFSFLFFARHSFFPCPQPMVPLFFFPRPAPKHVFSYLPGQPLLSTNFYVPSKLLSRSIFSFFFPLPESYCSYLAKNFPSVPPFSPRAFGNPYSTFERKQRRRVGKRA